MDTRPSKTITEPPEAEGCLPRVVAEVAHRRDRPQEEAAMTSEEWVDQVEGMGHLQQEEADPGHKIVSILALLFDNMLIISQRGQRGDL